MNIETMTLPTYEDIMLPLLSYLSDNEERRYSETMDHLAKHFKLDSGDLEIRKKSGGNLFYNRIGWAKDYLKNAGLLEKKTGRFKITPRGLESLKQKPEIIDKKFLLQFEEFAPYVIPEKTENIEQEPKSFSEQSPDDLIDAGIDQINNILKAELLEKLKTIDPTFFEILILDLVEKLGYGTGKHVGKSRDGGIDGEIPQDKLGLDMIYLQAKRHSSNVSPHDVRDFIGALSLKKSRKGIFITTSDFSSDAKDNVEKSEKNITLIKGNELVKLMIDYIVEIKNKKSINIKEIDYDYFDR